MDESPDDWRQRASEQILGDESLTDAVDDDAAEALIRWGLAQVAAIAARLAARMGAHLNTPAAETALPLEEQARLIRTIMKDAGRLAGRRADLTSEELDARLSRLGAMSAALQGGGPPEQAPAAPQSVEQASPTDSLRGAASDSEAVSLLLKKLSPISPSQPERSPDEPTSTHDHLA